MCPSLWAQAPGDGAARARVGGTVSQEQKDSVV